jgi:hypothetical protein
MRYKAFVAQTAVRVVTVRETDAFTRLQEDSSSRSTVFRISEACSFLCTCAVPQASIATDRRLCFRIMLKVTERAESCSTDVVQNFDSKELR